MHIKKLYPLPLLWALCILLYPSLGYPAVLDEKIAKSYGESDYVTAAALLEQQLENLKEEALKKGKSEYTEIYRNYILLAHIYAWRLVRPEVALAKYQELNGLRQSLEGIDKIPPFEFFYIGEIYEKQKNYTKAKESYLVMLKKLTAQQETKQDAFSEILGQELIQFAKYQIDGVNLKIQPGGYPLLLKKLNFSSPLAGAPLPLLALLFAPVVGDEFTSSQQGDLEKAIRQSPPDLGSMVKNYALIIEVSKSSVTPSSEKALEAYLAKYPESYFSLSLRHLLSRFYKENGKIPKARRLDQELAKIARKRGMQILAGPDARFSSPEKTWETFKKALMEGDVNTVKECYIPGRGIQMFNRLGKEEMKEIGETLGPIEKISATRERAEYWIRRKEEGGKELTYPIYFHNLGGEWKMQSF